MASKHRLAIAVSILVLACAVGSAAQPTGPAELLEEKAKPAGRPICFGAFPRETSNKGLGRCGLMYRPYEGLVTLSEQTGLRFRGAIVYLTLTPAHIQNFRLKKRAHYLTAEDLEMLTQMVAHGAVLRLALEPVAPTRRQSIRLLANSPDVLQDLAATLSPMGPCSLRIASELNLYDSRYHVPTTSEPALRDLKDSFAAVQAAFKKTAPNITLSFSAFIPNFPDSHTRNRKLNLIRQYLPYVQPHVDMLSGTFYPHSPQEVSGLVEFASLATQNKIPLGIDEVGSLDHTTFRAVMKVVASGKLGDLQYLNFFDYHVQKPGFNNPWHLKDLDKQLLRNMKHWGLLVDAGDES